MDMERSLISYPLRRSRKKLIFLFLILIIAIIAVTGSTTYYFLVYNQKSQNLLGSSTQADQEEIGGVLEKLGKLMVLPKNEQPTMATVSDKNVLPKEPFFERAENGDRVIIYSVSGRAILYRPSTNQIIDIAVINEAQAPPTTLTPAPTVPISPTPSIDLKSLLKSSPTPQAGSSTPTQ